MRNAFAARDGVLLKRPWILAWLLFASLSANAASEGRSLTSAVDFSRDSVASKQQQLPLLVLFSRSDCSWCERIRREHLQPMAAMQPPSSVPAIIRQVEVDGDQPLRDFDGAPTTHRAFATRMGARMTPTLMFLGPDGKPKAETIVGYRLADFFAAYIQRALDDSRESLLKDTP